MFCKICGQKNHPASLYCLNDGVKLEKNDENLIIEKGNYNFCRECGSESLGSDLYCSNCGESFYKIEERGRKKTPNSEEDLVEKSLTLKMDGLIKYGLGASGLIILISILIGVMVNTGLSEFLYLKSGISADIKIMKFLDALPIINGGSMKVSGIIPGEDIGILATRGMFIICLIIPILVFTLLGSYLSKKTNKKQLLKEYGLVAISYALIITILSIFTRSNLDISSPYGDYKLLHISRSYGMSSLFINGLLISFFPMLFGNGVFNFIKGYKERNPRPLEIASIIIGVGILYILITSMVFLDNESLGLTGGSLTSSLAKSQLATYLLIIMNMGKASMIEEGDIESISLVKNSEFMSNLNLNINITYLYIGLLIMMTLFFLYGRNRKKKGRGKNIEEILYSAGIFALGITIIGYMATININIDHLQFLTYKSNHIVTFIGSFSISLLVSMAGYFLASGSGGGKENV